MNGRSGNACILPSQNDAWTIHGIWPTKLGTKGPRFCNREAKLDVDTLEPTLLGPLKQFWLTLHAGIITIFVIFVMCVCVCAQCSQRNISNVSPSGQAKKSFTAHLYLQQVALMHLSGVMSGLSMAHAAMISTN